MGVPNYYSGKTGYITVAATLADIANAVRLPSRNHTIAEDGNAWDSSNSDGRGYADESGGMRKCTFTAECLWRSKAAAPILEVNGVYYAKLFIHQSVQPYEGPFLVKKIDIKPAHTGELTYTIEASFKGVYNSPAYATAIADSIANPPTGRFAADYSAAYTPSTATVASNSSGS